MDQNLHCFDTVDWAGKTSGRKKLSGGVLAWLVICLGRGADLHMAQLMR